MREAGLYMSVYTIVIFVHFSIIAVWNGSDVIYN